MSLKLDNLYVVLKKVVSDYIEERVASNRHLSDNSLGMRVDKFENSWERYLDIKLSHFNSRLTFDLNSHGLPRSNMSVEAAE